MAGLVWLQHLGGTGKRFVVRGDRVLSNGREGYSHAGFASAADGGGAFWGGGGGTYRGGDGGGGWWGGS